jgi:hypothetical protein
LARLQDEEWTVWTDADGVPQANDTEVAHDLTVGHDGTVWLPVVDAEGCAGLAAFDGTAWRTYLSGYCVTDIAFAPDGMVWARGFRSDESQAGGLFRIDPTATLGP